MRNIRMPRVDKEILAAYSEDQIARLLEVCKANTNPDRDTAIVLTLLDTGARASEFVALNTNDIDLSRGTVKINCGKGGRGRLVFIGAKTRKALARYLASRSASDNPALWLSENNTKPVVYAGLQMFMRRLEAKSGVEVECHKFRRTCALMLHRNGARLTEIAAILGHSDLSVLRRYLDLQDSDAERAHRLYSPVDGLPM